MKKAYKLIYKILCLLPGCMREITGCKYICPRYWILERGNHRKLWGFMWITCMKEIKSRIKSKL